MLAGDRPARVHAGLDDHARALLRPLGLAGHRAVVADERVQVAVAGVEHVRDDHPVLAGEVLDRIAELAREYDLQVGNVFHAGDGNLHPLVCYDGHAEGEAQRAEELAGEIIKACVDAGGSITGEHGVGVDKKRYMPKMFAEDDLATFQRLRCAFDPAGLANPGKVMPTPRLCGEVPGPYRRHPLEVAGLAERF